MVCNSLGADTHAQILTSQTKAISGMRLVTILPGDSTTKSTSSTLPSKVYSGSMGGKCITKTVPAQFKPTGDIPQQMKRFCYITSQYLVNPIIIIPPTVISTDIDTMYIA